MYPIFRDAGLAIKKSPAKAFRFKQRRKINDKARGFLFAVLDAVAASRKCMRR
jgi:hypothetical protein